MPSRNPSVPVNFADLYVESNIKRTEEFSRAKAVLGEIISELGLDTFKNQTYVRGMTNLAQIKDTNDQEMEAWIIELRADGNEYLAALQEEKLDYRKNLGKSWAEALDEFIENETKLYNKWNEEMIAKGLESPFLRRKE